MRDVKIAHTLDESCRMLAGMSTDELRADADAHFAKMAELNNLDWANKQTGTGVQQRSDDWFWPCREVQNQ